MPMSPERVFQRFVLRNFSCHVNASNNLASSIERPPYPLYQNPALHFFPLAGPFSIVPCNKIRPRLVKFIGGLSLLEFDL